MTSQSFDLPHLVRHPKNATEAAPILFLFHGFAGNEHNLYGLADHIPDDWLVVSARGPITVGPNQYKWFEVDRADDWFDVPQADRKMTTDIESERNARALAIGFIDKVVREHNADPSQIVVTGFSQGAALALNLFLTRPDIIMAGGSFGGLVMDEIKSQIAGKDAFQAKNALLGFGTNDPFISPEQAIETQRFLENFGIAVTVSTDHNDHSISSKQWGDFCHFLETLQVT